ncbi:hypothetical protein, partial [Pontibacter sp. HJ8]
TKMAEINIERRKKPVWPWILLIILLALIGWVAYEYLRDDTSVDVDVDTNSTGMVEQAGPQSPQYQVARV